MRRPYLCAQMGKGLYHFPMKTLFLSLMSFFIIGCAHTGETEVKEKTFTYEVDGREFKGFIADGAPEGQKAPGVIVVHEWWGQNEYPRERARKLAEKGYVAFAIDMFGEGKVATHPDDAKKFAGESMKDPKEAKRIFDKAVSILKERDDVNSDKIAAIGYCYGGAVVLNMASMGSDLDLVGSFHGALSGDMKFKKDDDLRVFIFNGADDPMVTSEQLASVRKSLNDANIRNTIENYPGAKHAFTNPGATEKGEKYGLPLAYNEKADKDSWDKFLKALKEL